MSQDDLQRGLDWAKQESLKRGHAFSTPERQPGEEPITSKQLAFIQQLATNIELDKVRNLGKWQASALIDHLMATRDAQSSELGEQWAQMQRGGKKGGGGVLWKIVIGLIALLILLALLG
jgi:hypothetical protein